MNVNLINFNPDILGSNGYPCDFKQNKTFDVEILVKKIFRTHINK